MPVEVVRFEFKAIVEKRRDSDNKVELIEEFPGQGRSMTVHQIGFDKTLNDLADEITNSKGEPGVEEDADNQTD